MSPRRVRIDWRFKRGAKKPENVVSVARGTSWGNPFPVSEHGRDRAIELFRAHALDHLVREPGWLDPLRGRDLACYCKADEACHADVLIELANR